MRARQFTLLLCLLAVTGTASQLRAADGACDKPYVLWNAEDVQRILSGSAWSKETVLTKQILDVASGSDSAADSGAWDPKDTVSGPRGYGMTKGSGVGGEKELYYSYTARLFSAKPIRQAYVRSIQLQNDYDLRPPAERLRIDVRTAPALTLDVSGVIVVSIEFATNDREASMEVNRQLKQAQTAQLLQQAYLITEHAERVQLKEYVPPSNDGTGAKLVFPRTIDGEPIVSPKDKELILEFYVPGSGDKVFIVWDVAELLCNGLLEL